MKKIKKIIFYILLLPFVLSCKQEVKRPNFLVILTDDQRMDALGCYNADCPIKTPNMDKLANEGIRFTNGFVTTPICVVSRACILTGRYATNNRVHHFLTKMEDEIFYDSYPVHLRKAGYFTGTLGKYGIGFSEDHKNAFDVFEGQAGQGPAFRNYKGKLMHDAEWLSVKTEEFLNQVPKGQPFSLQLNYKEPHESSEVAPEDDDLLENYFFGRNLMDSPEAYDNLPEHVKNGFGRKCYNAFYMKNGIWDPNVYMRYYFEKVVSVDRSVGKIFNMLEEKGVADNTVIIFLSDHGTHHGEMELGGKWTPYDASLRIPFIVYDPRKSAQKGITSDELVLNIDIASTLLDMAGIEIPGTMDGKSLKPIINNEKTRWRDHFFFEHYTSPAPMPYIPRNVGLRTKTSKYIQWIDFQPAIEEYFDLAKDSLESENLINNPNYQSQIDKARKTFEQWRKENPSTYSYDVYGKRPQYGAPEIDWKKFKQARPKEYDRIKTEIDKLGVTWEQAMDDWDIRYKICRKANYWY